MYIYIYIYNKSSGPTKKWAHICSMACLGNTGRCCWKLPRSSPGFTFAPLGRWTKATPETGCGEQRRGQFVVGKPWEDDGFMECYGRYPLVNVYSLRTGTSSFFVG